MKNREANRNSIMFTIKNLSCNEKEQPGRPLEMPLVQQ
jgi:hypothetical protein